VLHGWHQRRTAALNHGMRKSGMRVTIDNCVLTELQHIVDLHRKHGAPNPFDDVEGLVGFVLACVADGSRRPGAWERTVLEAMGLVADCPEHHLHRADCGAPMDSESALPQSGPQPLLPASSATVAPDPDAECDDPAALVVEITQLLFRTVAALLRVLSAFDTSEFRDVERWPRQSAALQQVYAALGRPWPAGPSAAD
jgi:hypothetical protein